MPVLVLMRLAGPVPAADDTSGIGRCSYRCGRVLGGRGGRRGAGVLGLSLWGAGVIEAPWLDPLFQKKGSHDGDPRTDLGTTVATMAVVFIYLAPGRFGHTSVALHRVVTRQ